MISRLGTILRVDLSSRKISKEEVDDSLLRKYVGGRGYGSKILFDENPVNVDPFSPENRLIFATGPLTGRSAPAAGRYMVITKSPLTGYIASSNSGGYWGAELAKAGWFMLIIEGKSDHPVYMYIENDHVEIKEGSHLWGLNTHATTDKILEEINDAKAKVLCIGPGGEKLSRIASIMNDKNRAAGRSGVGAVMGSKNLKAIVVKGTNSPYVSNSKELSSVLKEKMAKLKAHPVTSQGLPTYGTAILVNIINQTGAYPYRNWQGAYMDDADKQSGEILAEKYLTNNYHCFGCPIGCGRITKVKDKAGEGPEYETIFAFGACCGIASIEPIIRANYLCNEYGLDTISAGVTIAAAMELYEKKLIAKEELEGGPELTFGNEEAIVYWTEKMGKGEGFGKKLAQGSWQLCNMYGHPELSMTVKKQEMPAYDARGIQGIGLTYAVSNRGACHVRGYLISPEILGAPEKLDPDDISQKPMWAKIFHDLTATIDSSGMCLFTSFALDASDYAAFLKAATGFDYTGDEIMTCGERIWNLERLFNLREGLIPSKEDTLPPRLLKEPIPEGPGKGKLSRVPEMLPEYYKLRGWDEEGVPTEETRKRLDLTS